MKAFVQRSVFVLLALLAARGDGLRGQWKIVAPNLFRYGGGDAFAAMHVKDGIVWAGVDTLWFSSDTGKTWKQSRFTQRVYDINFFNTNIGVVGAADGVYLTSDGGQTWGNVLLSDTFPITSIAFGRTDSVIYALNAGATV